uniref:Ig-like domain-containing protein n=1 Tax=Kwoniella bestiolae CBS 10118 TaxID=1296100 RepID=A0A1B9FY91_9TREE|nr:hypothetical protein I302_06718 [Kwoniella bestiolae CBS 10118]OCF23734.1 hypothetical protein I302_06718 [Kwoniella bestiolae CBS 10118]
MLSGVVLLAVLLLGQLGFVDSAICGTITATSVVTSTQTTVAPTIVTSTRTIRQAVCSETPSHITTVTNHRRTDIYTTTTRTPTVTRTSTVATHYITVTSPGRTILVPCPTPRTGGRRSVEQDRLWADQQGLSNAERLQLGLPLAKPHQRRQITQPSDVLRGGLPAGVQRAGPSCTTITTTSTSTQITMTTLTPTTIVTVTSCAFTVTTDRTNESRTCDNNYFGSHNYQYFYNLYLGHSNSTLPLKKRVGRFARSILLVVLD